MNKEEWKGRSNEELFALYFRENDETEKRALKQEITLRYLYIVKTIAFQMRDMFASFMQPEDIINEGVLEIMKGIERYDPDNNIKFETFISRRIRGMVIDLMRKNDWMPRNFHRDQKSMEDAYRSLSEMNGRAPTDEELSESTGIDIRRLRKIRSMKTMVNVLSLDMTYEDNNSAMLQVPEENINALPEKSYLKGETVRMLADAINSLQEKEKMIISLYYVNNLNMSQIAHVMEISQPRVSQLHTQAVKKLRKFMLAEN